MNHRIQRSATFRSNISGSFSQSPLLISSEVVFNNSQFAALPDLEPSIEALEVIRRAIDRISYNKAKCRALARKAITILYAIRDTATGADAAGLSDAISQTNSTLRKIQDDVVEWCTYSFWASWYLRDNIASLIRAHDESLTEVTKLIQTATMLQVCSEVERLQKILKYSPVDTKEHKVAEDRLFEIRNPADKTSILHLPLTLDYECVKLGSRPAISGSAYDIWEGLWLGRIRVALKFNRDFRAAIENEVHRTRLERQVEIWRKLDHPYVLRLHGLCKMGGGDIYLVSPWMANGNIKMYLAKEKPDAGELVRLIQEVAEGLKYLHDQQICHGALRPSNVLIRDDRHAVISDFSLSKLISDDAVFTQSNGQTTSFRYQAPEISENEPMSTAGDVYSWAMTTLEIVSGQMPYHQIRSPGALMKAVFTTREIPQRQDHRSDVLEAYPELWDLLILCWNGEKDKRPTIERILEQLARMS